MEEKVKVKIAENKTVDEILKEHKIYKNTHLPTYRELYKKLGVKTI